MPATYLKGAAAHAMHKIFQKKMEELRITLHGQWVEKLKVDRVLNEILV